MRTLKQIAFAGLAALTLGSCVNYGPVLEGKVVKEQFLPDAGFGGRDDTYIVKIELPNGSSVTETYYRDEARKLDMACDVGNSVEFRYVSITGDVNDVQILKCD